MRFKLRTLMVLVALVAVCIATMMRPLFARQAFLRSLRDRDVVICTTPWFPGWKDRELFCSPQQVQVLLRRGKSAPVRILGKDLTYADATSELQQFKSDLNRELGFADFSLVTGMETWPEDEVRQLWKLEKDVESHLSPCGIENFKSLSP